jgi:hypothetical protein
MKTTDNTTAKKAFNKQIIFVDAKGNRVNLKISLDKYFSISGDMGASAGQISNSINPANNAQKELLSIWDKYHLNDMKNVKLPRTFLTNLNTTIAEIEEAEEERKGAPISYTDDGQLIDIIADARECSQDEAERVAALVKMFDLSINDLSDVEISDSRATVQGIDYHFGTDEEMDIVHEEYLQNYLDECVLSEIKDDNLKRYFDSEQWIEDAKQDGRAHSLNNWDGSEEEAKVNNTFYFAYRN